MSERNMNSVPQEAASADGAQAGWGALAQRLIHLAARRAPPDLSERLEEEWRADAAVRSSVLSQLRFALGCCWATSVIVREHPTRIPVPSAAIGPKVTIGYASDESGLLARRSITLFLVAGLHIGLFYALMTGLTFQIIKEMPTSFQTRLLPPPQALPLPPPPPPQLTKPSIDIPPPLFPPTEGASENRDIVAEPPSLTSRPDPAPEIPPQEVVRVQGGPGSGFPNTDDYYPSSAKRMEEQGVTTVRVCVGANGRLTSVPTIAQSSGSPRLDDAALLLAKAGSGHYRAATEDGRPVNSCYAFRVRFALRAER
jgi:TonB family protein